MTNIRSPRAVDVHVGYRVRAARQARKITQEGLAGRLGITFQQVQKYENGRNRISAGRLHQMAIIMNVPITFFFEGIDEAGTIEPAKIRSDRFLATRQGTLIANAFPQLGKRTQQAILDLMKAEVHR